MAYRIEGSDIVIDGFEKGIAQSPYLGLADVRNSNIVSIPDEASVGFSTTVASYPSITGATVTSADATTDIITYSGAVSLENRMSIVFSATTVAGISINTVYWVGNVAGGGTSCKLYTDQAISSLVNITSSGTGTFATLDMSQPKHWARTPAGVVFLVDASGYVWGTNSTTVSGYFSYTGNTTLTNASGNGLAYYQGSDGTGWLFVFRNARIDYTQTNTIGWVYGWTPATGGSGGAALVTGAGVANSHHTLVGQDNVMYWCDANYLGSVFEKSGQVFDPTSTATYTYAQKALTLPFFELALWLTELGTNLLIMGARNFVYPWDRTSTSFKYPIMLSENAGGTLTSANIPKMVTLNTNVFIFTGNRGRIYITNGTQAELYAKVPDHISGTVDPYFTWGAVGFNRNQLYFGVKATTNGLVANSNYGGLWAIDTDTKAMRIVNRLSYATYAGYPTVFVPQYGNVSGAGFFVGWDSGLSTYGTDISSSTPYTNYETYIDSEMIPVGLYLTKRTFRQVEFKLTTPLVSGEGVKISYRTDLSQSFTQILEDTTVGDISTISPVNFQKIQWLQLRIELKSTASSPSYTRLREVRIR